jgi:hypothetical protein
MHYHVGLLDRPPWAQQRICDGDEGRWRAEGSPGRAAGAFWGRDGWSRGDRGRH